jgi:hypothetical protein
MTTQSKSSAKTKVNYVDTIGFGADVGGRGFHIRVGICDIDHGWYHEFGSDGKGDGQFTSPTAITHGPDDRVYLADEELNRITVYDPEGEFISYWGQKAVIPAR